MASQLLTSIRVALLLTAFSAAACNQPGSPSQTTPLSMTRLRDGEGAFLTFSGYEQQATLVLRDSAAWQASWTLAHRNQSPMPALPAVDFGKEMIVLAALGMRPSSGYNIIFTQASEANGVVTVDVQAQTPPPNCATLPVVTAPLDLARLPARPGAVEFRIRTIVRGC